MDSSSSVFHIVLDIIILGNFINYVQKKKKKKKKKTSKKGYNIIEQNIMDILEYDRIDQNKTGCSLRLDLYIKCFVCNLLR